MLRRLEGHIRNHAIAYVALFVGLTGGAMASAHLRKGSVTSRVIRNGGVKTADLADGAVTAAKLGTIPASKIACPSGTVRTVGLCMEVHERGGAAVGSYSAYTDQETCANLDRRMPTLGELRSALLAGKVDPVGPAQGAGGVGELTFTPFSSETSGTNTLGQTWMITPPDYIYVADANNSPYYTTYFRCVTGP